MGLLHVRVFLYGRILDYFHTVCCVSRMSSSCEILANLARTKTDCAAKLRHIAKLFSNDEGIHSLITSYNYDIIDFHDKTKVS